MVVDDIKPLLQELTHKMQFFEDSILLRTAKITNMCDALKMISMLIRSAAAQNPTDILIFNDSTIIGVVSNSEYILVGHCKPVEITFRRPKPEFCTNMLPVTEETQFSGGKGICLQTTKYCINTPLEYLAKSRRCTFLCIIRCYIDTNLDICPQGFNNILQFRCP